MTTRPSTPPRGNLLAERGVSLLGSELSVLFRRRRTWAILAALAVIPMLVGVAVRLSSRPTTPGRGPFAPFGRYRFAVTRNPGRLSKTTFSMV